MKKGYQIHRSPDNPRKGYIGNLGVIPRGAPVVQPASRPRKSREKTVVYFDDDDDSDGGDGDDDDDNDDNDNYYDNNNNIQGRR